MGSVLFMTSVRLYKKCVAFQNKPSKVRLRYIQFGSVLKFVYFHLGLDLNGSVSQLSRFEKKILWQVYLYLQYNLFASILLFSYNKYYNRKRRMFEIYQSYRTKLNNEEIMCLLEEYFESESIDNVNRT